RRIRWSHSGIEEDGMATGLEARMCEPRRPEIIDAGFHVQLLIRQDADRQADVSRKRSRRALLSGALVQPEVVVHPDVPDVEGLDVRSGRRPVGRGGRREDRALWEEGAEQ